MMTSCTLQGLRARAAARRTRKSAKINATKEAQWLLIFSAVRHVVWKQKDRPPVLMKHVNIPLPCQSTFLRANSEPMDTNGRQRWPHVLFPASGCAPRALETRHISFWKSKTFTKHTETIETTKHCHGQL